MSGFNLEQLGDMISIPMPVDADGYVDRECPAEHCKGPFKVMPGTGILEQAPCVCPYCGHSGPSDDFFAEKQIEYATEEAEALIVAAFQNSLLSSLGGGSSRSAGQGMFSLSIEIKTTPPERPIYRHEQLETKIVCPSCDLHYAIFGKFAFCPDCGKHNSTQMLEVNLGLVERQLVLAASAGDQELERHLIENSLEDAVSAFDGFGRELVRVKATALGDPSKADGFSFQNLMGAEKRLQKEFAVTLRTLFDSGDFDYAVTMFLRRHVFAHSMGVVDTDYAAKSGDPTAIVGRRLRVEPAEVRRLAIVLKGVASRLEQAL